MSEQLKIFSESHVDKLLADVKNQVSINSYRENVEIDVDPDAAISSHIMVSEQAPELGTEPGDSENDRHLRRHAIARLWWAAHLTVAPWETDPTNFVSLKDEDRYRYTRELLNKQDVFLQILERSMGRSRRILIAFLEIFRTNPSIAANRTTVRDLIKEANLVLGYRKLSYLPYSTIHQVLSGLTEEIV